MYLNCLRNPEYCLNSTPILAKATAVGYMGWAKYMVHWKYQKDDGTIVYPVSEYSGNYTPCLPKCPSCRKRLELIRKRLDDGQRGIDTCFSNSQAWGGLDPQNDDCLSNPKLCDINAQCKFANVTYECSCTAGYEGSQNLPSKMLKD